MESRNIKFARGEAVIKIEKVCKEYCSGGEQVVALDNVDMRVGQGEFVAIIGQSGSGKSTLMNMLGCLETPKEGEYFLLGQSVKNLNSKELAKMRSRAIGFVFQSFYLLSHLTALENVELSLKYMGVGKEERVKQSMEALEDVGLLDRMHHYPNQLSGGQQQRVAIARAIVGNPPVILADEPTGNLDQLATKLVMEILLELWKKGHTVIIITHDPKIAACAPKVMEMKAGILKEVV